jgi:hypothetical protein
MGAGPPGGLPSVVAVKVVPPRGPGRGRSHHPGDLSPQASNIVDRPAENEGGLEGHGKRGGQKTEDETEDGSWQSEERGQLRFVESLDLSGTGPKAFPPRTKPVRRGTGQKVLSSEDARSKPATFRAVGPASVGPKTLPFRIGLSATSVGPTRNRLEVEGCDRVLRGQSRPVGRQALWPVPRAPVTNTNRVPSHPGVQRVSIEQIRNEGLLRNFSVFLSAPSAVKLSEFGTASAHPTPARNQECVGPGRGVQGAGVRREVGCIGSSAATRSRRGGRGSPRRAGRWQFGPRRMRPGGYREARS